MQDKVGNPHCKRMCGEFRWIAKEALKEFQMPPADEAIRERLLHGGLWDLAAV